MSEQIFPQLVGHQAAQEALGRALNGQRLSGAYLITGQAGIGRALLVRELAKAVNCKEGVLPPCQSCGPCHRIEKECFGDYLRFEPAGSSGGVGIEQVRQLLAELAMAPVEGRCRVFVVDPATGLSEPAQHALLKGLEEPPACSLLVLLAGSEEELLPTIVSRCKVIRLGALTSDQVEEVLLKQGLKKEEAAERARWSGGSVGNALADDVLELGDVVVGALEAFLSGSGYSDPMSTVEPLASFVDKGSETAQRRLRLLQVSRRLAWVLRDALVKRVGAERLQPLAGAPQALLGQLSQLGQDQLTTALERLVEVEEQVLQNVNPTLALEGLVLEVGSALAPAALRRGNSVVRASS